MKIKFDAKTIEISKTFADRASHFGSMEYAELRSATNDLPDFKVVVKSAPKRRRTYAKGLTYDFTLMLPSSALLRFLARLRQKKPRARMSSPCPKFRLPTTQPDPEGGNDNVRDE